MKRWIILTIYQKKEEWWKLLPIFGEQSSKFMALISVFLLYLDR
jgi:hypothetical protein